MQTMKDVARRAGVSVSTVSLVLSGRGTGRITSEVAERVRAVAAELGYVPNLVAKGLRTRQTHTIGLLSDRVASTPFAGTMLGAAQQVAWEAGYLLLLIDTGGVPALEGPATKALLQRNIDGLIYASMYHRSVVLPDVTASVPMVVLDGRPEREGVADWIVPDELGGALLAVDALIQAGHRRIAFCNNGEPIPAATGRLAGYRLALERAGIRYEPSLVVEAATSTAVAGREAARPLLSQSEPPSAIFCFSDRIALGVYRAAAELGLSVPQDLSVVGFDNQAFVVDAFEPGLSTVQLPHATMGSWAARRILERVEGSVTSSEVEGVLAPCTFVGRQSVAPPRHS